MRDVAEFDGQLILRRHHDGGPPGLSVLQADPRILINEEIAKRVRSGADPDASFDGHLFRVAARNRTVVYQIVGYDYLRCCYLAEWPD